ncbi:MAG: sigma 54-interacting transcriptional regulator [Lachnospiraceae bacterium]|nr:sigma 54-interacting transcriptional regulator [Lachnospiraceae bacterium]
MKITAKEKALEALRTLERDGQLATAERVAEKMDVTRQVASHYLTRLLEEGQVKRTGTKPVYWNTVSREEQTDCADAVFSSFIGYAGSQRQAIHQCIAAVKYPPDGLNLLITGDSGVGKSYLAHLIYQYAVREQILAKDAPYLVLNCADYANNPELLSSALFGYTKGAFTGAAGNKEGLIAEADGGYLFLDEVHRLSRENQEKLFLFMDTGRFRPLGENKIWKRSCVRFIFATTEDIDTVFLDTFRRRIQTHVHLGCYSKRPASEKYQMIQMLYQEEAEKVQAPIRIKKEVLGALISAEPKGNIGRIKNIVKQSCAESYCRGSNGEKLEIRLADIAHLMENSDLEKKPVLWNYLEDMTVSCTEEKEKLRSTDMWDKTYVELERILDTCMEENSWSEFSKRIKEWYADVQKAENLDTESSAFRMQYGIFVHVWRDIVERRYGIQMGGEEIRVCFWLWCLSVKTETERGSMAPKRSSIVKRKYPRSWYVAEQFCRSLQELDESSMKSAVPFLTLMLSARIPENVRISGLLAAHGEKTASSIQAVVNHLCGTYILEGIDMPIDTDVEEIVLKAREYIKTQVFGEGLILIVDTGSLSRLYTSVRSFLKGELLVIDNLTTSVALDIGLKIQAGMSFTEIAERAEAGYQISAKYYEGFSKRQHIIISCMSGAGISEKVKEVMETYLAREGIELITMDYRKLKTAIAENQEKFFRNTMLVITTNNLPENFRIPHVNIYDILDEDGAKKLWPYLHEKMEAHDYEKMLGDLLKLFSREGVAGRLQFLNSVVVINEVEAVLKQYESYYHFQMNGKLKLNLYMHLALMLERLLVHREDEEEEEVVDEKERHFYEMSHRFFNQTEEKYNIRVSQYELSLLYELLSPMIEAV